MIRVKDAEKSLQFYQDVLGMSLIRKSENVDAGFTLFFLAYSGGQGLLDQRAASLREGILELTWNHGTEKDENFSYHNGNNEPQGFGHLCKIIYPSSHIAFRIPHLFWGGGAFRSNRN